MPRANRHYIPGYVWHITHRCHKKEFLLKFALDRRRWIKWLYEAKKRYGLSTLNYMVTSNHIHLMVSDSGDRDTIPKSIQLIAGRNRIEQSLLSRGQSREIKWTEGIAVGGKSFIETTLKKLGIKAKSRKVVGSNKSYELREPAVPYGANFTPENVPLRLQNTYFWSDSN